MSEAQKLDPIELEGEIGRLRAELDAPVFLTPDQKGIVWRLSGCRAIAEYPALLRNDFLRRARYEGYPSSESPELINARASATETYLAIYGALPDQGSFPLYKQDLEAFDRICKRDVGNRGKLINQIRLRLFDKIFLRYPGAGQKRAFWGALASYLKLRCAYEWDGSGSAGNLKIEVPEVQWSAWQDEVRPSGIKDGATITEKARSSWTSRDTVQDKQAMLALESEHPLLLVVPHIYAQPHQAARACFRRRVMDARGVEDAANALFSDIEQGIRTSLKDTIKLYAKIHHAAAAHDMARPLYLLTAHHLLRTAAPGPSYGDEFAEVARQAFDNFAPTDPLSLAGNILTAMAVAASVAALMANPLGWGFLATMGVATLALFTDLAAIVVDYQRLQDSLQIAAASRGESVLEGLDPTLTAFETDKSASWEVAMFAVSVISLGFPIGEFAGVFRGFRGGKAMTEGAQTAAQLSDDGLELGESTVSDTVSLIPPVPQRELERGIGTSTRATGVASDGAGLLSRSHRELAKAKRAASREQIANDLASLKDRSPTRTLDKGEEDLESLLNPYARHPDGTLSRELDELEKLLNGAPASDVSNVKRSGSTGAGTQSRGTGGSTTGTSAGAGTSELNVVLPDSFDDAAEITARSGPQSDTYLASRAFRTFVGEGLHGAIDTAPKKQLLAHYQVMVRGRYARDAYWGLYNSFKTLVGRDEAYKALRSELGYLDKLRDDAALHRHWEGMGWAKQVDDPPNAAKKWLYLVDDSGVWRTRREIDFGHVLDVVVFDKLAYSIETHLLEIAARTGRSSEWFSYRVYRIRKLFMDNAFNYIPELKRLNRQQGAMLGETYTGAKVFGESLTRMTDVKATAQAGSALPPGALGPVEVLEELLGRMADELDMPELLRLRDQAGKALAGDQAAIDQLSNFRPSDPASLSPYLGDDLLRARGLDPGTHPVNYELMEELLTVKPRQAVDDWHGR